MDPERWRRIEELFAAAVEREPEARADFLAAACGGDAALRAEVEALLSADAQAGGFIEGAVGSAAGLLGEEPDPVEVLGRVGKYEVLERIGEGGFGVVYKGRDPALKRTVAIKTCSSKDRNLRRRFFREAQIAASLQHPNITTVHDLGIHDGVPFLVQEFLSGEDLASKIARRDPLPPARRLEILLAVARGLAYAHAAGVLHRDVKPANVRVLEDGAVKIMDFGIAKLLHGETGLTSRGVTLGTVGYLAPEQLRGEELDHRADVFAFGVLAYELLTYERAFPGGNFSEVCYRVLEEEPPPLAERWPGCPPRLAAAVARCLAKAPGERYAGLGEAIADLEPLLAELEGAPAPARVETPTLVMPSTAARRRHTRVLRAAAAAAVLLAGLGVGLALLRPGGGEPAVGPPAEAPAESAAPEAQAGEGIPGGGEALGPGGAAAAASPQPSAARGGPDPGAASGGASAPGNAAPPAVRSTQRPPAAPSPAPAPGAAPAPAGGEPGSTSGAAAPPGPEGRERGVAGSPAPPAGGGPGGAPVRPPVAPGSSVPGPVAEGEPAPAPEAEAAPAPATAGEVSPPAAADGWQPGEMITPGPGVVPPVLLSQPRATYPPRARRRRVEARVVVMVLVDAAGRVAAARLKPGQRAPLGLGFNEAALAAARGARFQPATRDGQPGKMWTELPFEFRIE